MFGLCVCVVGFFCGFFCLFGFLCVLFGLVFKSA